MQYPISSNERERLKQLYKFEILDTPAEKDFDDVVRLATQICNMPFSFINLIDANRQWNKAAYGSIPNSEMSRNNAICNYTIEQDNIFEVKDCNQDERFSHMPYVLGHPNICYYAGIPLTTSTGYKIGTLCICDTVPRNLTTDQQLALEVLSRHVISMLELRVRNKQLQNMAETQNRIISIIGHDIRNPLSSFRVMLNMQQDEATAFDEEELKEMNELLVKQLDNTIDLLNNLVQWGKLQMKVKETKPQQVDLESIATRTLRDIEIAAAMKGNMLHKQVSKDMYIDGDDAAIEFVLRNLLSNANKFTENGKIIVACDIENDRPRISVTDTGVGMNNKQIHQVLNETGALISIGTHNERGSGLGLSLVREFLAKHNSQLNIQSAPGEGTTVSFHL